jgi:rhodanese-related sulfurtransferase
MENKSTHFNRRVGPWLFLTLVVLLFVPCLLIAQRPGFFEMVDSYTNDFPTVTPKLLENEWSSGAVLLLDAREPSEYRVSRIPGARFIGVSLNYEKIRESTPLDTPIVVYCSVGARSQDVAIRLKAMGYTNIRNMYGGIFYWAGLGFPMEDHQGNRTIQVHGYNTEWGKWVWNATAVYE